RSISNWNAAPSAYKRPSEGGKGSERSRDFGRSPISPPLAGAQPYARFFNPTPEPELSGSGCPDSARPPLRNVRRSSKFRRSRIPVVGRSSSQLDQAKSLLVKRIGHSRDGNPQG